MRAVAAPRSSSEHEDGARSRSPLKRRSCHEPWHEESNPEPWSAKVPTRVDYQSTRFIRPAATHGGANAMRGGRTRRICVPAERARHAVALVNEQEHAGNWRTVLLWVVRRQLVVSGGRGAHGYAECGCDATWKLAAMLSALLAALERLFGRPRAPRTTSPHERAHEIPGHEPSRLICLGPKTVVFSVFICTWTKDRRT